MYSNSWGIVLTELGATLTFVVKSFDKLLHKNAVKAFVIQRKGTSFVFNDEKKLRFMTWDDPFFVQWFWQLGLKSFFLYIVR